MSQGNNKCAACGQWSGRGHKCPTPTSPATAVATVPARTAATPAPVDDRVARAQAFLSTADTETTGPKTTGKQGTDIPPLVVQSNRRNDEARVYVSHPDYREAAASDRDAALDARIAFPSFTTVLPKPDFSNYAAAEAGKQAEEVVRDILDATPEEQAQMRAELLATDRWGKTELYKLVSGASRRKSAAAADRGTQVHALAEALSRGENPDVPEELEGYVRAYQGFAAEFPDIEYEYTEATTLNEEAGAMGTVDAIVRLGGKRYIMDYKTNAKATVYNTAGLQMAAGANAEWIVYPDGTREPMPKIDGAIGVGLGPDGTYNVYFFETDRDGPNHTAFKNAVSQWHWQRKHRDSEPVTRETLLG